jgi:Zn-dependent protease with chaperone function
VGILNVGFVTVAALVAVYLDLPERVLYFDPTPTGDAAGLLTVAVLYAIANAPFDIAGGYLLPKKYGRPYPSPSAFAATWLRGVAVQSVIFVAAGASLLYAGRVAGVPGATAAFAAATLALLLSRPAVSRLVGGTERGGDQGSLRQSLEQFDGLDLDPPDVTVYDADDVSFVGGPTYAGVVVPSHWMEKLSEKELTAAVARRAAAVETGSALRGVFLAVAWNLVGFVGSVTLVPGAGFADVASLINLVLGYVVWSFVALLVLPTPTRAGVFEADVRAVEAGVEPDVLESTIRKINQTQGDDEDRTRLVESVFHPIPSVERRVERLGSEDEPKKGAWNAARVRLYLSWAGLDFLSRAVHCNVGRPGVWVFLPGD